ncbi:Ppx/GppA phosphatase family protein [Lichenihabitans sp. Uapishka_5]|uniref:Ppx/GppA phosphatase family protein n=1 Tax=Lichenihabitans sp. Uapishka_5 TaxID=3037302 RepID=UPI0029E81742|nr:Ppx/GppA phosphatase family protein [Lichenihabitans sp. Uapishka_5]MDX7951935.1 Ppx/GppA phosphatase family protein [Lichenihabitans sp. Uapishka_5]
MDTATLLDSRSPQPTPGAARVAEAAQPLYGALDLGTNNCRLLVARPSHDGFRIVDSFSRIVRLGEGLALTGRLNPDAIERTLSALTVCRDKLRARGVTRMHLVATEACRQASNGAAFIDRVAEEVGLALDVVDRETEATLAASGCAALADRQAEGVLLFDIGGGSSELVWLDGQRRCGTQDENAVRERMRSWTSLPLGVVTLADRFGGHDVTDADFEAMVAFVSAAMAPFVDEARNNARCDRFHLLGTSGTVTTVAGVFLDLPRYDRRQVDGLWMSEAEVTLAMGRLRGMSFAARAAQGCIGPDRADLVLAGCAILEAIRRAFPCERLRIADRGLREGILMKMMLRDNAWARLPGARTAW